MFRYPGGKSRLYKYIAPHLIDRYSGSITIPFIGAGHVTTRFCSDYTPKKIWINDVDPTITAVWKATYFYPFTFLQLISNYKPCVDDFYKFKEELKYISSVVMGVKDVIDVALKKLVIHQISYSGLGVMAGSPIGGKNQSSKYDVGCRWNSAKLHSRIARVSNNLKKINDLRITTWDFRSVLKESAGLTYLDPPYVEKGNDLYNYGFSYEDHWALSEILYERDDWVLSYDDCPTVRNFYSWANIDEIDANYSIKGSRKKTELIISNKCL
jgi:DNA adenine methylase